MRVSTKGRYAMRMLLDIALNADGGAVTLADVAQRQGISKKYLEQIVTPLMRAGIIRAKRGVRGGYALAVPPEECSLLDVLSATEGCLAPAVCLEPRADCARMDGCLMMPVWRELETVVADYMKSVTLKSILDGAARQPSA